MPSFLVRTFFLPTYMNENKSIVAIPSRIRSTVMKLGIEISKNNEVSPSIQNMLNMLLPIIFATAMSWDFFIAARAEVTNSGREVPMAMIVAEIRNSERPNWRAMIVAEVTVHSPPK